MEVTLSRQLIRFHYDFSFGPERKASRFLLFCTNTDKQCDLKWDMHATKYPAQFSGPNIDSGLFECLSSAIDWKCLRTKISGGILGIKFKKF